MFLSVGNFHLDFLCEYRFKPLAPLNTYIHSQELFRLDLQLFCCLGYCNPTKKTSPLCSWTSEAQWCVECWSCVFLLMFAYSLPCPWVQSEGFCTLLVQASPHSHDKLEVERTCCMPSLVVWLNRWRKCGWLHAQGPRVTGSAWSQAAGHAPHRNCEIRRSQHTVCSFTTWSFPLDREGQAFLNHLHCLHQEIFELLSFQVYIKIYSKGPSDASRW